MATAAIVSTALVGAAGYLWLSDKSLTFGLMLGLFALLVIPMIISDARRTFRPTNWLLWIRFDGLWINVRSYQDRSATDTASVIETRV